MKQKQQKQTLRLGEQLIGLSPTVCLRAIVAIRQEVIERKESYLPQYCEGLLNLLGDQLSLTELRPSINDDHETVNSFLNNCEKILSIIEGPE